MNSKRLIAYRTIPIALLVAGTVQANVIYTVSLDTSAISSAPNYALAFSLQDGAAVGDSNNTITLSNFNFGSGSGGGCPANCTLTGGVSGDVSSAVTLTDSSFFNSFAERFTPGNTLSFTVDLTTNVDPGPTPDLFGVSLLLNGNSIPTQDDTLGDNLLYFNIDSSNPTPASFATAPSSPVTLTAPTVAPVVVPLPSSLLLLGSGLAGLIGIGGRRVLE